MAVPAKIQGRFWPILIVSVAGRYSLIWPIWPDSGQISPVRRESEEEKKKKSLDATPTRGQLCRTRVRHPPNHVRAFPLSIHIGGVINLAIWHHKNLFYLFYLLTLQNTQH